MEDSLSESTIQNVTEINSNNVSTSNASNIDECLQISSSYPSGGGQDSNSP